MDMDREVSVRRKALVAVAVVAAGFLAAPPASAAREAHNIAPSGPFRTQSPEHGIAVAAVRTVTSVRIVSEPARDETYRLGEAIEVEVAFEEVVHVTGNRPYLTVSVGANLRSAALATGSGTQRLLFRYVVQDDDYDEDGISIAADALEVEDDGTIEDGNGNPVARSFDALAADPAHRVNGDVIARRRRHHDRRRRRPQHQRTFRARHRRTRRRRVHRDRRALQPQRHRVRGGYSPAQGHPGLGRAVPNGQSVEPVIIVTARIVAAAPAPPASAATPSARSARQLDNAFYY